ncbi:hypothetical protein HYS92_02100 [Candidatus Daviesbacteria bacterium]|nr:hypothetical protein [Candidatus Daviesbacteria bacterium]
MSKLNQQGFTQLLIPLLLLVAIVFGVILVGTQTNLFPKAKETQTPQVAKEREIDLAGYSKAEIAPREDNAKIRVSGTVFEDLNKNSIRDNNEVNVADIGVLVFLLYRDKNTEAAEVNVEDKYYSLINYFTDKEGRYSVEFNRPYGIIEGLYTSVGIIDESTEFPNFKYLAPLGWELLPRLDGYKNFAKGEYVNDPITVFDEAAYENIDFPIIGTNKISGFVFHDRNYNGVKDNDENYQAGVNVFVDASKAINGAKKLYITASEEDGSFEFNNLPPLSKFRVKASPACPWVSSTPPFEGLTLGSAGLVNNLNFGVFYNEEDSCVTDERFFPY